MYSHRRGGGGGYWLRSEFTGVCIYQHRSITWSIHVLVT